MIRVFTKETLVKGRPARIECVDVAGQIYSLSKGLITVVRLEDEWYEDVHDPASVIAALRNSGIKADIFTFWQRLPNTQPLFPFNRESVSIAVLPVVSFDHWWNNLKPATRNLVRKAERKVWKFGKLPLTIASSKG